MSTEKKQEHTPLPWEVIHESSDSCFVEATWAPLPGHEIVPMGPLSSANADLIVHSVNSLPKVVELLRDAQASLYEMGKAVSVYQQHHIQKLDFNCGAKLDEAGVVAGYSMRGKDCFDRITSELLSIDSKSK